MATAAKTSLKACLHGDGRPQIGEVTCGGSPHLSCKCDRIIWTGGLPHQSGLPHLPGVPQPHVNGPLESELALFSNFITLVPFHTSFLMLGNSSGVDSKELYLSSEKERENRCLALTSSIVKLETVEVSGGSCATIDGKKKVPKSVMHLQACCFAYLNLLLFHRPLCRRHHRHRCLSFLLAIVANPKHYPDLDSDTSQVWNFCARSSDIILPEM